MKHTIILSLIVAAVLVSCKSKTNTTAADKTLGTSPAFSGNKNLTASMLAEGKSIFENSCATCHSLPNPEKYSDEKWVGIMKWMAPKAKLSDEQSALVYNYVTFKNPTSGSSN
jgi:mono/diheme cytochrome c family protein